MTTKALFGGSQQRPVVISKFGKYGNNAPKGVVNIMRPSRFGNPFPTGSRLCYQDLQKACSLIGLFPRKGAMSISWLKRTFPGISYIIQDRGGSLSRTDAIECFREWWGVVRAEGIVTDAEILVLEGKELGCCCRPKRCHGDVLVEDYDKTKKGP
ncbi:MAG: DUF4326 domain-containing protein [Aeromonas popoffii]|uniref:DUF4326 domain-containing protein n=1 Tax=Aeromonas popoffii TaxID=70856 RepID=UPI003F3819A6